ncbi:MAG: hypothetical protein ACPGOV_12850 [Magnetovibrionaceae bacterium]
MITLAARWLAMPLLVMGLLAQATTVSAQQGAEPTQEALADAQELSTLDTPVGDVVNGRGTDGMEE